MVMNEFLIIITTIVVINFAASVDFTQVQYNSENEMSRMLMCFPWESDKQVYKWITPPKPPIDEMYEHESRRLCILY